MIRSFRPFVALAVLALVVAGCGSGEDDANANDTKPKSESSRASADSESGAASEAETEAAVGAAYTAWDASFDMGDSEATCSALSEEGRKQMVADAISSGFFSGKTCEEVVAFVAELTEKKATPATIHSVEVDGDEATLRVTSVDGNQLVTMERDGDEWLVGRTAEDKDASADLVEKWFSSWCSLKTGMTKEAASSIMGNPTSELDDPKTDSIPQIGWEQGAYSFTAFLDTDGKINQLQSDYSDLGATDRAKLKCPEVRR